MVTVASRSSLVSALLRNVAASQRFSLLDFLGGLSSGELECLAEFEGSRLLELMDTKSQNPYRLLADFFDSNSARWIYPEERAHKTFVVLEYLQRLEATRLDATLPH